MGNETTPTMLVLNQPIVSQMGGAVPHPDVRLSHRSDSATSSFCDGGLQ